MRLFQPKLIKRVPLPLSKSECNRWLILEDLFPGTINIQALSTADDVVILNRLLQDKPNTYDCGMAGTTLRFLIARLSLLPGKHLVTGHQRLKERPIKPLIDALVHLGASIEYTEKEGYAPVRIIGRPIEGGEVHIDNTNSSQFVSALMLIGAALPGGLTIHCKSMGVSAPYIYMTAQIIQSMGIKLTINAYTIRIEPFERSTSIKDVKVECDWSAASYGYAMVLLAQDSEIYYPGLKQPSFQGDALVANYFAPLGIDTIYTGGGVRIRKKNRSISEHTYTLNLSGNPDLAQTLVIACVGMGQAFRFTGLHTLKIKETDRLLALKNELAVIGANLSIGDDFIEWNGNETIHPPTRAFNSYNDHRMAMSLSALSALFPIDINNPEVVDKSFPDFFKVLFG
ncbi:MAG: 3-phosphoshikimate 1-carboxyvinyltransferase [Cryomorphaceae bacterium]|nr:3-phosphoshikimate 1-carboxyvinyltransferase [Cryomorphaceae bacterium]